MVPLWHGSHDKSWAAGAKELLRARMRLVLGAQGCPWQEGSSWVCPFGILADSGADSYCSSLLVPRPFAILSTQPCLLRGAEFPFHQSPLLLSSAICKQVTLYSWMCSDVLTASHLFSLNVLDVSKAERGWEGPSGGGDSRGCWERIISSLSILTGFRNPCQDHTERALIS